MIELFIEPIVLDTGVTLARMGVTGLTLFHFA